MKIIRARHLGFCYGVQRSLRIAGIKYPPPVYTYGELIHNARIVRALAERGINAVGSIGEVNEGTVIIRSHGAPKEALELAA